MALIDLIEVSKSYEVQQILNEVDLFINDKERIALLGKNGGGKSTLMKIINGTLQIDNGKRIIQKNIKVEMLEQNPEFTETDTVKEAIEKQLFELNEKRLEYEKISEQLINDHENKLLINRQIELSTFLDAHNAWNLDDKIERVLQEFDLKIYENRAVSLLSGGERRRVALAGLILKKPDILLLDEPTNHLDVYMVTFLEEMLLKEKFTLVFISHDRYFIDNIATRTIEIDNLKIKSFSGGYKEYLKGKEEFLHAMEKQQDILFKLLKNEEEWLNRGVKARLKRNEGRKQRVMELRDEVKKTPSSIKKIKLELEREKHNFNQNQSINRQKMLFELIKINKSLSGNELIKNFSTRITQKDCIAIVGKNGAGKSTLLKMLLGELEQDSGEIKKGDFKIGYFDQSRTSLDDDKNLIETFCPMGGDRVDVRGKNTHVYGYLKNFLFPKEYLDKKIGVLSGGEKNRVALALLFTKQTDCLILDEPTNDLDIPTINILEEALQEYAGAVIFVSHDRYFVDKIAKKLLIFKGNGVIKESYSSYSEFLEIEDELKDLENLEHSLQNDKNIPQKQKTKANKLTYKEEQERQTLPKIIKELENKIEEIKKCLGDPECYQKIGITSLHEELQEKEKKLEPLIEKYLEIEEKFENLLD